eukprot:gene9581-1783_t
MRNQQNSCFSCKTLIIFIFSCSVFTTFVIGTTILALYSYKDTLSEKMSNYSPSVILKNIKESPEIMNFFIELFRKTAFQNDRLWLIDPLNATNSKQIIADVSEAKEFSFLMNYYIHNNNEKYEKYIVDIGGFDAISFSNSYNFFQVGFSGVLVEPLPENVNKIYEILQYRMNINKNQKLSVVKGAISHKEGFDLINVYDHLTSNSRLESFHRAKEYKKRVKVRTMRLETMFKVQKVPENFFCLSVDIEGKEDFIISELLKTKHRPKFIIIEKNRDFRIPGYTHLFDTMKFISQNRIYIKND